LNPFDKKKNRGVTNQNMREKPKVFDPQTKEIMINLSAFKKEPD
jgi:hypothetical protein